MSSVIEYEVIRAVAVITIKNPPVNATSHSVRVGLLDAFKKAQNDSTAKAIVLIGAGKTFIAGADIREFGLPPKAPILTDVQLQMEASSKPVVAALHGAAFGGGLETALCCHYRVALSSAKLGLPEVTLGLLPGGGGTQRLPRLIGPQKALDFILSGKPVNGDKAFELGIIDCSIQSEQREELLNGALDFALSKAGKDLILVRNLNDKVANVDTSIFNQVREKNQKKWAGQIAQLNIVDCIEAACKLPFDEGKAVETKAFALLRDSAQSGALRYAFFAQRTASKIPGLSKDIQAQAVNSAAIIGAGTMGGGIAMCFANAGIPVYLLELTDEAVEQGMARITANYQVSVGRGSMSQAAATAALALITATTTYNDIANVDIVIEAVFENMQVKQEIFKKLDQIMKQGAVLASNTSALSIDDIASATTRPHDVIGTHFFSPANIMKLQENVRGEKTSDQTIATVMTLAKKIGKVPVLAGNCDGFIGNRISAVYSRECDFMLEEGATPWQIDNALKAFGFPMGVYLMKDMAGLDIGWSIRKNREPSRDKSLRYSIVADRICEMGRFGQKTAAGYYLYDGRKSSPDPEIEALIKSVSLELGIKRRTITDQEIVERVLSAMANEGAKVVGDGIAIRASDIDVAYLFGFGFPRYQGGPMYWAQQHGLQNVLDTVNAYHKEQGVFWEPAPLLQQRAAEGNWEIN